MISDEYFYNLSKPLLNDTEELSLSIIERIKSFALSLSVGDSANMLDEERYIISVWQSWESDAEDWVDENLPDAYIQGIKEADKVGDTLRVGAFATVPLFAGEFAERISPKAQRALQEYAEHLTMYGVFQEQAYQGFRDTRIPIVRSSMDTVRDLSVLATDNAYINADTLTRRELSEEIMRPFLNKGVTGIRYRDGRTMRLDSYAEMVARTQTGNASRQANFNRLQEYGLDLVLISQHYPTSDLCAPYQGRVFSLSGTSDKYPSLQSAISGGLYHPNCKHSQAGYRDGQRIPEAREKVDSSTNKKRYEAQNVQRYNERQIRSWKRRQAGALTDESRQKARSKVRQWQARQRKHIDSNEYLRRNYSRES